MRWHAQTLNSSEQNSAGMQQDALLPLSPFLRSVTTPEFRGVTFHEIIAKSVLNRISSSTSMPFSWTINPYRGCSHACVYCFARKSHTYLDFDSGADFDSQVVVKVNAVTVLEKELNKSSWAQEHVALGTNTDPYQRAEGRYKLMPGIIQALADSGTPFSILTKGTLLARDVPLLKSVRKEVPVRVAMSLALFDNSLGEILEPGTPSPQARLALIHKLREAGIPCGVMAIPILPWLTDTDEALDSLFAALAKAGAHGVSTGPLHLRPGTKEWFMAWLAKHHPGLVSKYQRLYAKNSYVPQEYRQWLGQRVSIFKKKYGFSGKGAYPRDTAPAKAIQEKPQEATLF